MLTRKEKFHQVVQENKKLIKTLGIVSIGIFGSVARNEDTEKSDYDILVEFGTGSKSFKNFSILCDLFSQRPPKCQNQSSSKIQR